MSFITDLFDGGAGKATKKYQKAQTGIANQQQQEAQDVLPQYMKGLDFLSNYAGLGSFHPQGYGSYGGGQQTDMMNRNQPMMPQPMELGGMYQPPAQQPGWNWNQPGQAAPSAPPPAPGSQAFAYANTPGLNSNMMHPPPNLSGQGDGMGPSPYGKGDGIPSLPGVNPTPPQPAAAPQAQTAGVAAQRPISRQQQFIQGNPSLGAFNPTQSGSQNHQQIQQHQQGLGALFGGANGASGGASPMGPSPYMDGQQQATGGVSNSQMGIFNDPADALRNAQAQDDINHNNFLNQQNFKSQLGERGLEDSSILGGGLSRMNQDANQQYAGYRRNLAMNAGQEQMNRVMQMMQALNPGMGAQQQAQQGYQNLGQQSFQQQQNAQQGLAGMGNFLGQLYGYGMF